MLRNKLETWGIYENLIALSNEQDKLRQIELEKTIASQLRNAVISYIQEDKSFLIKQLHMLYNIGHLGAEPSGFMVTAFCDTWQTWLDHQKLEFIYSTNFEVAALAELFDLTLDVTYRDGKGK